MLEIVAPILALLLGLVVGWQMAAGRARQQAAVLQQSLAQAQAAGARAEAESAARERALAEAADRFEALAGKALQANSERFLTLAETRLKTAQESGASELEARKKAIEVLVKPLDESLKKLDERSQALEVKREKAYSEIRQQVESLANSTKELNERSLTLDSALRGNPQVRGNWGEVALRNVVEMAGMTEHCDFDTQVVVEGGRPDLVVRLPGGGKIPVDSKVPLADYLSATAAQDPALRGKSLASHAKAVRGFVKALQDKDYATRLGGGVDFTVLFIPSEPALAAAFGSDPELQEEALRRRILIATPVTLMALLLTVRVYWKQELLARNAREIADAGQELYQRTRKFQDFLEKLRKGLDSALKSFNEAAGSWNSRLLPQGRRLDELGGKAAATDALSELEPLEEPRELSPPG